MSVEKRLSTLETLMAEALTHLRRLLPSTETREARYQQAVEDFKAFMMTTDEVGTNPSRLADYLRPLLLHDPSFEISAVVYFDGRHKPLAVDVETLGPSGGSIDLQPILRKAVDVRAAAVVWAHNHHLQDQPSKEDVETHHKLGSQLQLLGVNYLDSLIVTKKCSRTPLGYVSVNEIINAKEKED